MRLKFGPGDYELVARSLSSGRERKLPVRITWDDKLTQPILR